MVFNIAGYDVLIDDEDYEKVRQFCWRRMSKKIKNDYFQADIYILGERKTISLHRLLVDCPKKKVVDHVNGNTLDNRKENLRICTQAENVRNAKLSRVSSSGLKGVTYDERRKKWRAKIQQNKKSFSLGYFQTKEEAYQAYCEASKKYHGEFGRIA